MQKKVNFFYKNLIRNVWIFQIFDFRTDVVYYLNNW